MRSYFAAFLLALILCLALTPLARRLALRVGAVSSPGGRHTNTLSVPRLGGIAIALSALSPIFTLLFVDSGVATFIRQRQELAVGLLIGGTLLCLLGALDDVRQLSARTKLVAQLAAAGFAYAMGFRIEGVMVPFYGPLTLDVFALPVTLLWIVGITNAVNLIDGLDGLAAGVVFFAAVTNLVVALMSGTGSGTIFVALLMVSVMGAMLGFLFYNFNPARIFMGDSGSYFLGFVLATSSLMAPLQKASTAVSLLAPIVALGVPIFDTLFSMLRRYLEHRPMFSPDRGHLHHRLIDMGITHRRAVLTLYGASVVFAASAIAIALGRDWEVGLGLLGACVVLAGLIRAVGYIERAQQASRRSADGRDSPVERLRRAIPVILSELSEAKDAKAFSAALERVRDALGAAWLRIESETGGALSVGAESDGAKAASTRISLGASACLLIPIDAPSNPQTEVLLRLVADELADKLPVARFTDEALDADPAETNPADAR